MTDSLVLSERVGSVVKLGVTRKDSKGGPSIKADVTCRLAVNLDVMDMLGGPEVVDEDGVVVSSMRNEMPSDVWRRMFDDEGVPLPLGIDVMTLGCAFEEHALTLQYNGAGKPVRPVTWNNVKLSAFKAELSAGPGMFVTFKASFLCDAQDIAWLSRAMCATLVNVSVKSHQEHLDLGGAS